MCGLLGLSVRVVFTTPGFFCFNVPYMEGPKHPLHLKYPDLQKSSEVAKAVEKKERLNPDSKRIPNDPRARIDTYVDRLENVFLNPDERVRERNTEMLRGKIYDAFLIKPSQVPESYFELQKRIARERGQVVEEISSEMRERMIGTIIEDQKTSLDRWMHYLQSNDAMYPPQFKYLVFRNIVKLSQFDKELGKFKPRTESTVAPFPDIYYEPLAQISDIYERVGKDPAAMKDAGVRADFEKKFPALYAELIQQSLAAQIESKEEIRGEWVKYEHGDMHGAEKLFESLQGKGTGWCTAGKSTAEMQIESGDFHAYYTYDKDGKPTQPRVAIRMEADKIAEVRGILEHQQMEPQMQEALDEKLKEFGPEADLFKKKSSDMARLTGIDRQIKSHADLSSEDLRFLYEIDNPIEGFGYETDPRIEELRGARSDALEDIRVALGKDTDWGGVVLAAAKISDAHKIFENLYAKNLSKKDELQMVDTLIAAHRMDLIVQNASQLRDIAFNAELALHMIEKSDSFNLIQYLDAFENLTPSIARRLLSTPKLDVGKICERASKFGMTPEEVMYEYIMLNPDARYALHNRTKNLPPLPKIDYDTLAKRLIDEQNADKVGALLDFLKRPLPQRIATELIFENVSFCKHHTYVVSRGLTKDTLFKLIDAGKGDETAKYYLEFFKHVDHNEIALKFIERGYVGQLASNLGSFRGLSQSTAEEVREKGYQWSILHYQTSFRNLSESYLNELRSELLASRKTT